MKVEVLIATMNRKNMDFLNEMHLETDATIINQCDRNEELESTWEGRHIKWLSYAERGLSRSRNRALAAATGDICLLADDDVIYEKGYEQKILEAYRKYEEADLIAFQVRRTGKTRLKKYRTKGGRQNFIDAMKISSVEITFKRKSILEKGIQFQTLFGAGAYFNNGEENIFLADCLRKKLKIVYVPVEIGSVCCDESSWFEGYNAHYFRSMGAGYYGMSQKMGALFCWQHLIRRYKLYKKDRGFWEIARLMKEGRRSCKQKLKAESGRMKTFLVGDFKDNNGPAMVNKALMKVGSPSMSFSLAEGKVSRLIELFIKIIRADTIIFSGLSRVDQIGTVWAHFLHKPVFYLMHGYMAEEMMLENEIAVPKEERLMALERWMLEKADVILPVSQRFQSYLEEKLPQYNQKMHYLNNGIDWQALIQMKTVKKEKETSTYILTSIGGMRHIKNNLAVCRAIEKIKDQLDRPVVYQIIGPGGKDEKEILAYDFVTYYGQLPHIDVLKLLQKGQLYIQNSYVESFSLSVIEALVLGNDLLISKNVGAISILEGLKESSIIKDVDNSDEIGEKIMMNLRKSNNECLLTGMVREKTSWEYTMDRLQYFAKEMVDQRWMLDGGQ